MSFQSLSWAIGSSLAMGNEVKSRFGFVVTSWISEPQDADTHRGRDTAGASLEDRSSCLKLAILRP